MSRNTCDAVWSRLGATLSAESSGKTRRLGMALNPFKECASNGPPIALGVRQSGGRILVCSRGPSGQSHKGVRGASSRRGGAFRQDRLAALATSIGLAEIRRAASSGGAAVEKVIRVSKFACSGAFLCCSPVGPGRARLS